MKTIVTYSSKYGYTKRYAERIAELLNCKICDLNDIDNEELDTCDVLIHGGGMYAGIIRGLKKISKKCEKKNIKLIAFTTGLADCSNPKSLEYIVGRVKKTVGEDYFPKILHYYFRGGIDYSKLSVPDKTMMAMMNKFLVNKGYENLSDDLKNIVDNYGKEVDYVDTDLVIPLVEYVKSLKIQ